MKPIVPALLALLILSVLPLSGCKSAPEPEDRNAAEFKTSVHYRERLMLPPGCTLTVSLDNISRLDGRPDPVASTTVKVQAAPPFPVALGYDPLQINDRLRYSISARIELNGQVLFASTERIDPFATPPDKPIKILVHRVKR